MKKILITAGSMAILGIVAMQLGVYPVFAIQVLAFGMFASAFNLLLGHTGLLSFGHAAFLGAGAYGCGYAIQTLGWSTPTAVGFGVGISAALGLAMGSLAIRRSGIYFAMITLALAQMLYFLLLEAPFTHGEDGLQGIERGNLLGLPLNNDTTLFYVVLGIFTIAFLLIQRIAQSPFGQLMMAIRDNENRATSLGHNTYVAKLLAFVISSGLAGLAGSLKAVALGFASLGDAHWSTSGLVILMVLLGGLGTAWGPLLGALLIITLDTHLGDIGNRAEQLTGIAWFGGLGESVGMVTGLVFLGSVLAFRRGIVGTLIHLWHKQARARSAQSVDPTTPTTTDHIA